MVIDVELYSRGFRRLGWLNDASSVSVTWRHNRRGQATIVVPADHVRAAQLLEPGGRVVVTYRPDGGTPMTLSGEIGTVQAQGPRRSSTLVVTVRGDWVDRVLAWPVPGASLGSQSVAYWTATGPAETVVKSVITANALTRLALPWIVATNLGRGSTVSISARMVPLSDVVEAAADLGGIGVRVAQPSGAVKIGVDCYVGTDRTARVLSEDTGAITAWSLTANAPTATRAVVGLQGEAEEREFTAVHNADAESAWAKIETFIDARDLDDGADGALRGADKLAEAGPTLGLSVTLAETDAWRVGRNLHLGDLVTVAPIPGVLSVERVTEIRLSYSSEDGLRVEPILGNPDSAEPERALASTIRQIATAIRTLRAR